jgi:hypothetical protein
MEYCRLGEVLGFCSVLYTTLNVSIDAFLARPSLEYKLFETHSGSM